jgi:transcription initiation factor IIE alpha subunit
MPWGTKILPEVQWIVVRLSSVFDKDEISIYTGLSVRSIERVLQYFNTHQTIKNPTEEKREKRCALRDIDVEVLPDHFIDLFTYL